METCRESEICKLKMSEAVQKDVVGLDVTDRIVSMRVSQINTSIKSSFSTFPLEIQMQNTVNHPRNVNARFGHRPPRTVRLNFSAQDIRRIHTSSLFTE